jgi:hypothetical protein
MFYDLYIQRAMALVQVGREKEALMDFDVAIRLGGQKAVLRMQVYLRSHGFPDIVIDGKRSAALNEAIVACFLNDACGRGIAMKI